MPIVEGSGYRAPIFFRNPHAQTVYPSVFRKIHGLNYVRERIITQDDDFLDLDWSTVGSAGLAITLHGLEGDSRRSYMKGMVRAMNSHGWDAVAVNFRGCSGEPNRRTRMYHSGETQDLQLVIDHALSSGQYRYISLIGFSLGGNVILKYLGESGASVNPAIMAAVALSAPCDLKSCSDKLDHWSNWAYSARFLKLLRKKIETKAARYPHLIDISNLASVKTLKDFDEKFTAPIHGFRNADDYYRRSSSRQFIGAIRVPCLLINSQDDPFLTPECYPLEEARTNPSLFLEIPEHGGHVGFVSFNERGNYWSETRSAQFVTSTGAVPV